MPTTNPRLSVVLSHPLAATLAALSEETGDSASSLVRGLLDQAHPALARMLQLVKAAKQAKGQVGAGLSDSMKRVVDDLEDAMALADSRTGRAVRDLVAEAEDVRGRRRPRASGASTGAATGSTPVPVTRGSGGAKQQPSRSRKGRAGGQ